MTIDPNEFFRRASLLICSSLDMDIVLRRCRECISIFLPADIIFLNVYEPRLGGLRSIARADSRGGRKIELILPLPEDAFIALEGRQWPGECRIINRQDEDPLGRIISRELELEEYSAMVLRLRLADQQFGFVHLFAKGFERYKTEHLNLFDSLREVFTLATNNSLQYRQAVNLQEQAIADNHRLSLELSSRRGNEVIGAEQGLREVSAKIRQVAPLKSIVLLRGELGVGKEVIAQAIHDQSPRRQQPFIRVNCGAIPESSLERELFGLATDVPSDGDQQQRGCFERADRGTIFLDNIWQLPGWAQLRLLRLLQTREIERIDGAPAIQLDFRLIVAAHNDLEQMVIDKEFREDLWLRINSCPIDIPPLRDRLEDIPPLVLHFIKKQAMEMGIRPVPEVSLAGLERLMAEDWPGNVRQLANRVERELIVDHRGPLHFLETDGHGAAGFGKRGGRPFRQPVDLDCCIKAHIEEVLAITGGKINGSDGAAALLDVHPNTLRNKMKKLGICYGRQHRQGFKGSV